MHVAPLTKYPRLVFIHIYGCNRDYVENHCRVKDYKEKHYFRQNTSVNIEHECFWFDNAWMNKVYWYCCSSCDHIASEASLKIGTHSVHVACQKSLWRPYYDWWWSVGHMITIYCCRAKSWWFRLSRDLRIVVCPLSGLLRYSGMLVKWGGRSTKFCPEVIKILSRSRICAASCSCRRSRMSRNLCSNFIFAHVCSLLFCKMSLFAYAIWKYSLRPWTFQWEV